MRLTCGFLLAASIHAAGDELTMARPFGSHMVLPMNCPVPVWGTAPASTTVKLQFAGQHIETRTNTKGDWKVILKPMPASSESRVLRVEAGVASVELADTLVGVVWLFSGQSNMDFPLARATGGREEVSRTEIPGIRLFDLQGVATDNRTYGEPDFDRLNEAGHFKGRWERAAPASAAKISAIAWWTARRLHDTTGVPVGMVENAVGGSGTEAWIPRAMIEKQPAYASLRGDDWAASDRFSAWARGRVAKNLGDRHNAQHPFRPGFLFESGVHWWNGFPFDGVVWYQGETNAELHDDAWNRRLLTDLVTGWRSELSSPGLPFVIIQLPRIGGNDPLRRWWPEYRAVQESVASSLPGVRLVKTADLGWDSPDVHPPDKLPVATRLAEAILAGTKPVGRTNR